MGPFQQMLCKVVRAQGQAHSARTVEIFGWIMVVESAGLLFAPHFAAWLLHLPSLSEQAANYLRRCVVILRPFPCFLSAWCASEK